MESVFPIPGEPGRVNATGAYREGRDPKGGLTVWDFYAAAILKGQDIPLEGMSELAHKVARMTDMMLEIRAARTCR